MYGYLSVYNKVLTAFLCQHGCIVLWVFTTKSLLPFCVSMDISFSGCSQPSHYCLSVSAWIYLALGVHNQVITAFLCQNGYILLWVFTTKSLLPFCVSMDTSCSWCSKHSHDCLSVLAWIYCAMCSQPSHYFLLPFCVSINVLSSGCSQHSQYCLSVSSWIYLALGVQSIAITAFLCQHGYIFLWVFTA
ncbi:hypothetical protein DPMN_158629 [Dreissena polymorpha]|uniref:Uncharacterized protein n=1 Tax=Dreissena polymorpha TaxID=45954 RepID=A0A9D4EI64_DREPO|nr:hypothetical protein DPMN_158629 [Dreissena polymorpha]